MNIKYGYDSRYYWPTVNSIFSSLRSLTKCRSLKGAYYKRDGITFVKGVTNSSSHVYIRVFDVMMFIINEIMGVLRVCSS